MMSAKMRCLVTVAVFVLTLAGCTEKPRELRLYTWKGDFSPQVIKAFEKKYECVIKTEFFDSNEAMLERIRTDGPGCFDLIEPSSYVIGELAQEGLIVPIDHAKCPSVKRNFSRKFVKVLPEDPELKYAVPYNVSSSGFLFATNGIPPGAAVDSWAILGNPALKGGVILLDDMRELIGAGLMYLGHSVNSENAGEVDAAVAQVLKWVPNADHWDFEEAHEAIENGGATLALTYSGMAIPYILGADGRTAHPEMAFVHPKEGYVLSCEEFVVTAGCREPDLAHAFLEFLYSDPANGRAYMEHTCTLFPCAPAIESLDPAFRKLIEPSPEVLSRGQVLKAFYTKLDVQALYERAWERVVRSK